MSAHEKRTKSPDNWGKPETIEFFERWSRIHISSGIYERYFASLGEIADELLGDPESVDDIQVILEASNAEFPLAVQADGPVQDNDGNKIGDTLWLKKVDPRTGTVTDNPVPCLVGFIELNGGYREDDDGTRETNELFTDLQLELLLEQYREQQALGVTIDS